MKRKKLFFTVLAPFLLTGAALVLFLLLSSPRESRAPTVAPVLSALPSSASPSSFFLPAPSESEPESARPDGAVLSPSAAPLPPWLKNLPVPEVRHAARVEVTDGLCTAQITDPAAISALADAVSHLQGNETGFQPLPENAVRGSFLLPDGEIPFWASTQLLSFNGICYGQGQALPFLYAVLPRLYNAENLARLVEQAASVRLYAQDMNASVAVSDRAKLLAALKQSSLRYSENGWLGNFDTFYPQYSLELERKEGGTLFIFQILNPAFLIMISNQASVGLPFQSGNTLWNYCLTLLPPKENADPNEISSLFQASSVRLKGGAWDGAALQGANSLVRVMNQAPAMPKPPADTEKADFSLAFTVKNRTLMIPVYKNGFVFRGTYYESFYFEEQAKSLAMEQ